jgi:DNA glycosylase AlkZ-like
VVKVSWAQALAWRMRRHELDPVGRLAAPEVVRRLCGVQAQVASSAELAIRVRSERVKSGDVGRALADGDLIKTWAMRGTLHLLTPEDAGAFLSLLASGRPWERPAWQRYFQMDPATMERFRDAVREALDGQTLTREELIEAVTVVSGLEHIGDGLRSGWGTLLKPVAWQGHLCFGPQVGTRVTFMRPDQASRRWAGIPEPDAAGPIAVAAYVGAYGPATVSGFRNWLSRGLVPAKRVQAWFTELGDALAPVDVDGEPAFILAEDLDALVATKPSRTVRLLGGFDQWVLGPGTDDPHVIASPRRGAVSKQSGWIAPIVVDGGVVSGTWEIDGEAVRVAWFSEGRKPRRGALEREVERLATIYDRPLRLDLAAGR